MSGDDLSSYSMEELFRADAEGQCATLSDGLLALEKASNPAELLESLMRAAHSLKGAARIIGLDSAVKVAHVMEDIFVTAQKTNRAPNADSVDGLLRGVDLLKQLAGVSPGTPEPVEIDEFVRVCQSADWKAIKAPVATIPAPSAPEPPAAPSATRRDVRLDAERLDTLLGLAGQAVVASQSGTRQLLSLRGILRQLQAALRDASRVNGEARRAEFLAHAMALASQSQAALAEENEHRDLHGRSLGRLCNRIYNETLACRMRPFGDITAGLRRLARDVTRDLGKETRVEIQGEDTEVDRDLLDRLDGPLSHLVRNALDHGLELPAEREKKGKPREGCLQISARHQSGWLVVSVADDGRGPNYQAVRSAVVARGLAAEDHVAALSEPELLDFLLLPGFSLSEKVTEISGRGVGLDAVRAMAYASGGSLRLLRRENGGFLCEVILPVSLSLVRTLIVEIGGDFFALPLTRVERVMQVLPEELHAAAGRQHIFVGSERLEILSASQVLELESAPATGAMSLVILHGPQGRIGLAVDRLVGQRELSLQRVDPALGRIQDVSATALLDTGEPVVVLDVDDLAVTAVNFSSGSRYRPLATESHREEQKVRRILVADDSLTVRELERKLLAHRGYAVETAVDGADAWNALRSGHYDLLVTDIDMPRVDGIELTRLVRADARLRDMPVVVVSYKDRDEDRSRGLEAGADFYLPKSSYQDESLLNAVQELIGDPLVSAL